MQNRALPLAYMVTVGNQAQTGMADIAAAHPGARTWYFADDLVDLQVLRAADVGTLVNGSWFSRSVCRLFFRGIRVWP